MRHARLTADVSGQGLASSATDVSVLLGNGDGSYQPRRSFVAGNGPVSVAVADFNGDGRLDLAVANNNSNSVSVLINDTRPTGSRSTGDEKPSTK